MAFVTPKTWSFGEVLTSTDMNTYVRDNTADLDARVGDAAAVKQVVYFTGGSSQSTTSTSFINTNITASITPSSVDSKILIFYSANHIRSSGGNRSATAAIFTPDKDGTNLGQGQTKTRNTDSEDSPLAIVAVHSPGVTTSVTYMVCLSINISDQTASLAVPNQLILVEVDI